MKNENILEINKNVSDKVIVGKYSSRNRRL